MIQPKRWYVKWYSPDGWVVIGLSYDTKAEAVRAVINYQKMFPRAYYIVSDVYD